MTLEVYEEAREILIEAGLELRKWASNSDVLEHLLMPDNVEIETEAGHSRVEGVRSTVAVSRRLHLPVNKGRIQVFSNQSVNQARRAADIRQFVRSFGGLRTIYLNGQIFVPGPSKKELRKG